MTKINIMFTSLVALALLGSLSAIAYAQTTVSPAPAFYTQTGVPVYASSAPAAGLYYTASGGPLYYYGNGYYYNSTTQTYGSIYSPGFVSTTYPGEASTAQYTVPTSAPDTGAGGNAPQNWALLIATAIVAASGMVYLLARRKSLPLTT